MIRVLDVETTGFPPDAAVCEIGWQDVDDREIGAPLVGATGWHLANPGRPMPPDASAIHHLVDADVAGHPSPQTVLSAIAYGVPVDLFAAHAAKFEQEFIKDPAGRPWICTYKCAIRLWPDAPAFSNFALWYWLRLNERSEFRAPSLAPHRAGRDAFTTAAILSVMLRQGAEVGQLVEWSGLPVLLPGPVKFGKNKGAAWTDLPADYLRWIVDKATELDEDTRFTAGHYLALKVAAMPKPPPAPAGGYDERNPPPRLL